MFRKLLLCFLILGLITVFDGCSKQSLTNVVQGTIDSGITNEQVTEGLKEALIVGINNGFNKASQTNGFYGNPKIRIEFPKEARKVESTLRRIGLSSEVDKFVVQLNRGAEQAALQAKPIFLEAVNEMEFDNAWLVLRGNQDAATQYLIKNNSVEIYQKFNPIIKRSLDRVNATRYYSEIISRYNRIPSVEKVNPNLEDYATKKTMEGLFYLMAKEEARIRQNPTVRNSPTLKRVFAHQ